MNLQSTNEQTLRNIKFGILFLILSPFILYIAILVFLFSWDTSLRLTGHYIIRKSGDIQKVLDIALEKKDINVCRKISAGFTLLGPGSSELIGICTSAYSVQTEDVDRCLKIQNYICVETIAENKKDPSVCTRIEDERKQGNCLGSYLIIMHEGIGVCDLATSDYASEGCKISYLNSLTEKIELSFCNENFVNDKWKEICMKYATDD